MEIDVKTLVPSVRESLRLAIVAQLEYHEARLKALRANLAELDETPFTETTPAPVQKLERSTPFQDSTLHIRTFVNDVPVHSEFTFSQLLDFLWTKYPNLKSNPLAEKKLGNIIRSILFHYVQDRSISQEGRGTKATYKILKRR